VKPKRREEKRREEQSRAERQQLTVGCISNWKLIRLSLVRAVGEVVG
jgi:hypothetical protein